MVCFLYICMLKKSTIMKKFFFICYFGGALFIAQAQEFYDNAIGVSIGNAVTLNYKRFVTDKMAVQVDASLKFCLTQGKALSDTSNTAFYMFNQVFSGYVYYQKRNAVFSWIAGGGIDVGHADVQSVGFLLAAIFQSIAKQEATITDKHGFKIGANAILGFEVRKNHFGFQLDMRPGYGLVCLNEYKQNEETGKKEKIGKTMPVHYFDYSLNLGFRYNF